MAVSVEALRGDDTRFEHPLPDIDTLAEVVIGGARRAVSAAGWPTEDTLGLTPAALFDRFYPYSLRRAATIFKPALVPLTRIIESERIRIDTLPEHRKCPMAVYTAHPGMAKKMADEDWWLVMARSLTSPVETKATHIFLIQDTLARIKAAIEVYDTKLAQKNLTSTEALR